MTGIERLKYRLLDQPVSNAPLVTFRVVFSLVMLISMLRYWALGWIETQLIQPQIHFKYFGFYWLPEPSATGYYLIFSALVLSALGILLGAFYRISAVTFFLLFTYIELIDSSYYLNHYYFISIAALLLVFLPAHKRFSVDAILNRANHTQQCSAWTINLVKFQLALVYFMAGLAKLNADWLFNAQPLMVWLPAMDHLPVIGPAFAQPITAYVFSWSGALYDLSIPFFLIWHRSRALAYVAVIAFHVMTWVLFPIGMFPFIMIGATLIFFSAQFHERIWQFVESIRPKSELRTEFPSPHKLGRLATATLIGFVGFQLLFPFRHVLYEGNAFWHEQGYRFGWRVMLMEKAGYAQFKITDESGNVIEPENRDFLNDVQIKMMSTQSDMMLQYAAFLKEHYQKKGVDVKTVTANVYVCFNGRPSQPYIDPTVDLASIKDSWQNKTWILPLQS